jgi:hypothetical protein
MTIALVNGPVITGDGQLVERAMVVVDNDIITKVAGGHVSLVMQGGNFVSNYFI